MIDSSNITVQIACRTLLRKTWVNENIAQKANDENRHNDINYENAPKKDDEMLKG